MTAVIDWDLAERVAARFSGREPFADSYHYDALAPDFAELTAIAEDRVATTTGLRLQRRPRPGPGGRPTGLDRRQPGLVPAPAASPDRPARASGWAAGPLAPVTQKIAGAEVGALLGLDVDPGPGPVRPAGGRERGPRGPGHRLLRGPQRPRPREALRLPAPRVPPVAGPARGHPPGPVHRHPVAAHPLPRRSSTRSSAPSTPTPSASSPPSAGWPTTSATGASPSTSGGLAAVLASPEQRLALDRVAGLMSLLEGHGDVTMDRAGADRIPSADRFGRVLRQRRQQTNGLARLLQTSDRPRGQAGPVRAGREVHRGRRGRRRPAALDTVWEDPARLPTLAEIRDPAGWLARIDLAAA